MERILIWIDGRIDDNASQESHYKSLDEITLFNLT